MHDDGRRGPGRDRCAPGGRWETWAGADHGCVTGETGGGARSGIMTGMDDYTWVDDLSAVDLGELSHLYEVAPLGHKPPEALPIGELSALPEFDSGDSMSASACVRQPLPPPHYRTISPHFSSRFNPTTPFGPFTVSQATLILPIKQKSNSRQEPGGFLPAFDFKKQERPPKLKAR